MTTLELLELIALIVAGIVIGIYWAIKAIKNHWLSKIYEAIKIGIRDAEQTNKKGKEKLEYTLKYVQLICDEEGIPFVAIKNLVIKTINKLIEGYNTFKKGK